MSPRAHTLFETVIHYPLHSSVGTRIGLLEETSTKLVEPSTGKQLLDAILKNSIGNVYFHLDYGANPNVHLGLTRANSIDQVFLWKKLFGEIATPVHLALLNVYHKSFDRRNKEVEAALGILKLLLLHGGDVSTRTTNLFLRQQCSTLNSPLDLAMGIKRMTLCTMVSGGRSEAAMDTAVNIMKNHYTPDRQLVKMRGKSNIPFTFVNEQQLEILLELLFSKEQEVPFVVFEDDAEDEYAAATTQSYAAFEHDNSRRFKSFIMKMRLHSITGV